MRVVTGTEMREIDRETIEEFGTPGLKLMEEAGKQTALRAKSLLNKTGERNVLVVAGPGNNGGDGMVAARYLHESGVPVRVYLLDPEKLSGDASEQFERLKKLIDIESPSGKGVSDLADAVDWSDLVIDAVFGTGFSGEPKGAAKDAIDTINNYGNDVLAVDTPSGVEADTGKVKGSAVRADETITFGLPKLGCVIHPGASYSGDVVVVDIGFPQEVIDRPGRLFLEQVDEIGLRLPKREDDTHKKATGMVFVVAGSRGMTGAAAMTAESALRSGAGIVTLGIPSGLNDIMEAKLTEVMTVPISDTSRGTLAKDAHAEIRQAIKGFDIVALGPGLSTDHETVHTIKRLIEEIDLPVVLDADGLNAVQDDPGILKKRKAATIITPHPGELSRLLKVDTEEINEDRLGFAGNAAKEWGVTVVLKGNRSLIASLDGLVYVNPTGNPGMASAGTGDVLTGIIAGFWAQGMGALDAAVLGTYLHGLTGDLAVQDMTRFSLAATDLIAYLPKGIRTLEEAVTDIGHPELESEE